MCAATVHVRSPMLWFDVGGDLSRYCCNLDWVMAYATALGNAPGVTGDFQLCWLASSGGSVSDRGLATAAVAELA